ncbi:MAG: hypothetical protein AAF621_01025, partial [Pseudomonadota bacterium]
ELKWRDAFEPVMVPGALSPIQFENNAEYYGDSFSLDQLKLPTILSQAEGVFNINFNLLPDLRDSFALKGLTEIDPDMLDQQSESDTNPLHLESVILRENAKRARAAILKNEENILEDARQKREEAEYNKWLYNLIIDRKARAAQKKKLRTHLKNAFFRLLTAGRDDQDINMPIMVPLPPSALNFTKIFAPSVRKVSAIDPIEAVKWSKISFVPTRPPIEAVERELRDFTEHIYAGLYRAWVDQNVLHLCPQRERSPPL